MTYFIHHVFERVGAVNGEANEQKIRFWVRERAEPVILLLSCRVPESQLNQLSCRPVFRLCNVVFEDGRDVFLEWMSDSSLKSRR